MEPAQNSKRSCEVGLGVISPQRKALLRNWKLIQRREFLWLASAELSKAKLRRNFAFQRNIQACPVKAQAGLSMITVLPSGSEEKILWARLGWTAVGTFAASACASTLNQVFEVANDSRMKRTMMRPLPLKRVSRLQALTFAALTGVGGVAILYEKVTLHCKISSRVAPL